jgi:phospholipid/cholesterol/gamma-HCH transport system permease protein
MLSAVGRSVLAFLGFLGDEAALLYRALTFLVRGRVGAARTIEQMAVAGTDSLPIVVVTLFLVGMAWSWQTASLTVQFGATSLFGGGTALAVTRELGPALCGVVVAARIGAAYAAELGTMTVTEQVDALRSLAINPTYYLVVPRLVACTLMLPVLTVFADAAGIFGAYLLSSHFGISSGEYTASIAQWLSWPDISGGIIKAFFFGALIALIGCRQGLRATGGAAGVGQATISSVVFSIMAIYLANLVLTAALYATQ